ncbi:hypothetical protein Q8F55_003718 [Vanrija albida]|uniref:BZIP domain-containing protein n=1 Tax=Vanrija albida TaxID=181172 RepID=A0ABR3Q524_9TREE
MSNVTSTPSSSKRAASAVPPSTPAAKRARPSSADKDDEDDAADEAGDGEPIDEENMDDEAKAKAQRREARTIRNRESAQRSRNQRKAHLAWLEQRVVELEAENRVLRTGSTPSSPMKTRESSPANSIVSLASDLGIPAEIVSAGGGVNLATVAPPPADVQEDIKPFISTTVAPPTEAPEPIPITGPVSADFANDIRAENAALRWRVGMLENIVKQAATFFSAYNAPVDGQATPVAPNGMALPNTPFQQPAPGMSATLSPPMYPTVAREAVQSPLRLQTELDTAPSHPTHVQSSSTSDAFSSFVDLSTPVARHPAARARGSLTGINLDLPANGQRLAGLDLGGIDASFASSGDRISIQDGDQADGWFPEGASAAQWDQEMNDLLETLEGSKPGVGVSPVVPGSAVGVAAPMVTGEEWAWEAALVDF